MYPRVYWNPGHPGRAGMSMTNAIVTSLHGFQENFSKFVDHTSQEVIDAGPKVK